MKDFTRMPSLAAPRLPQIHTSKLNPARWAYDRLVKYIAEFEEGLTEEEEIGLRLIATPDTSVMHIEDLGFAGPDMLIYYGRNAEGRPMQLLQHYTQMSMLLTAVEKLGEKPVRMGFRLQEGVEDGG